MLRISGLQTSFQSINRYSIFEILDITPETHLESIESTVVPYAFHREHRKFQGSEKSKQR